MINTEQKQAIKDLIAFAELHNSLNRSCFILNEWLKNEEVEE